MFHELPAATADMAVLPGVLGCSFGFAPRDYARDRQDRLPLRRTVQGTPRVQHPAVDRWHAYLHGLATLIHETSGLGRVSSSKPHESILIEHWVAVILYERIY